MDVFPLSLSLSYTHTQAETRAEFAERSVAKLEKTIDDLEGMGFPFVSVCFTRTPSRSLETVLSSDTVCNSSQWLPVIVHNGTWVSVVVVFLVLFQLLWFSKLSFFPSYINQLLLICCNITS